MQCPLHQPQAGRGPCALPARHGAARRTGGRTVRAGAMFRSRAGAADGGRRRGPGGGVSEGHRRRAFPPGARPALAQPGPLRRVLRRPRPGGAQRRDPRYRRGRRQRPGRVACPAQRRSAPAARPGRAHPPRRLRRRAPGAGCAAPRRPGLRARRAAGARRGAGDEPGGQCAAHRLPAGPGEARVGPAAQGAGAGRGDHPPFRREGPGCRGAGTQPFRRQPAEVHPRPRDPPGPAPAGGGASHLGRGRRRGGADPPRADRLARCRYGDPGGLRGPRRAVPAQRPHRRAVFGSAVPGGRHRERFAAAGRRLDGRQFEAPAAVAGAVAQGSL